MCRQAVLILSFLVEKSREKQWASVSANLGYLKAQQKTRRDVTRVIPDLDSAETFLRGNLGPALISGSAVAVWDKLGGQSF